MNQYQEIKKILSNKDVVQKYLGLPEKNTASGVWYKSPFRQEKTASFYVSEKGIHDFGSSEHYDIISFVQRYFSISPKQALEIICRDFGVATLGNEYETKEMIDQLKKKRQEEKKAKEIVDSWFNSEMQRVCNEIQVNEDCIRICSTVHNFEVLRILFDEQVKLEYYFEFLFNATEEEKIKLYLEAQNDKRRKSKDFRTIKCI